MILGNLNQARQFLPSLNLTLDNDRFNDFFRRAQAWLVNNIVGEEVEEILEMDIALTAEDTHEELRTLCQRVIAEKALLDAVPEMDMQLTEAGFAVQNNDDFTPASSQRVDRLMAKMPERIAADIDALVRFLLKNSVDEESAYSYWRVSEQFKHLTAAFIPLWEEYNKIAIPPATNYEDFFRAIPNMAILMKKVAAYYVSAEEVERLVELYRDGEALQVHRVAIAELKRVGVAAYNHDEKAARESAISAREVMLSDPDYFTAFKDSKAFGNTTINLDGGKMVNFL